ncbi:TPA: response regulator [Pseudomonas aeruginosa]|uniref:response regulator n=1 Tax=Pseudomonas aeruginosa TaxID=287 RepID=UPI000FFB7995|nr:response regulator [Pseudomonas aeruginosa]EKS3061114.1 response regulator [Pseudomonas aeruginosa]MBO0968571.1 response regulator [Pseudomonas aeruginosa]MBY9844964.1 response regulator [Pseudomonas aeruginosa]MCV0191961.1 response regulator [Pseudomonas aeruginosa]MDP5950887.1 response regulator [Pseudomonas aeruginosa]
MNNSLLLVEDEVKTAEMLKMALESQSIDVTWVTEGQAALDVMKKKSFDLVILDLKLPGMTGDETLEGIRKFDKFVDVVVYTNYQEPPVMQKLINLGVEGYISKGADASLWETVEKIKMILDPMTEEERSALLEKLPSDVFKGM